MTVRPFWSLFLPLATLTAQGFSGDPPGVVPDSYLVQFATRSFTLEPAREAIASKAPYDQRQALVRFMERQVLDDQRAFVDEVHRLGGKVTHQYWIINGCAIEIAPQHLATIARFPGVVRVEPDLVLRPCTIELGSAPPAPIEQSTEVHGGHLVHDQGNRGLGTYLALLDTGQAS